MYIPTDSDSMEFWAEEMVEILLFMNLCGNVGTESGTYKEAPEKMVKKNVVFIMKSRRNW